MFILHGTKTVHSKLGWVADYCNQCETVRTCHVTRLGHASHIYFIALSKGSLICYERKCVECNSVVQMLRHEYKGFSADKSAVAEDLIEETHPDLLQKIANRLDVAEGLASKQVLEAERKSAMLDIFCEARMMIAARGRETYIDKTSGWAIITTIVVCGSLMALGEMCIGVVTGILGLIVCVIVLGTDQSRYARRTVMPWLASNLARYHPELTELEDLAEEQKIVRNVARSIKLRDLISSADTPENGGPVND